MTAIDPGFKTAQEIEQVLRLPVLSSVDEVDWDQAPDQSIGPETFRDLNMTPTSRFNDKITVLRSAIKMSDRNNPAKVIQLTSTLPAEGKSTIAKALAKSAAISGLRILLVDAAIRRPALSHHLGMHEAPGLVELLRETARRATSSAIRTTSDA